MWNKRKHFCIQPMNSTRTAFTIARIILHLISFPQFSYTIYFICICHIHLFHGNKWTHNWPAPNISDFKHSLVGQSITPVSRGQGSNSVEVLIFVFVFCLFVFFFSGFLRIAFSISRIIPHLILQFRYLSPQQRPLCVVGRTGRKKKRACGARWEDLFPLSIVPRALFRLLLFYRDTQTEPLRRRESSVTHFRSPTVSPPPVSLPYCPFPQFGIAGTLSFNCFHLVYVSTDGTFSQIKSNLQI